MSLHERKAKRKLSSKQPVVLLAWPARISGVHELGVDTGGVPVQLLPLVNRLERHASHLRVRRLLRISIRCQPGDEGIHPLPAASAAGLAHADDAQFGLTCSDGIFGASYDGHAAPS